MRGRFLSSSVGSLIKLKKKWVISQLFLKYSCINNEIFSSFNYLQSQFSSSRLIKEYLSLIPFQHFLPESSHFLTSKIWKIFVKKNKAVETIEMKFLWCTATQVDTSENLNILLKNIEKIFFTPVPSTFPLAIILQIWIEISQLLLMWKITNLVCFIPSFKLLRGLLKERIQKNTNFENLPGHSEFHGCGKFDDLHTVDQCQNKPVENW